MERKLDYFIEQTNLRLEKIDNKLEQLISFRIMLIGASMTVATIFSIITTLITLFLNK